MAVRSRSVAKAEGQKREPFIQPLTKVIRNHGQLTPAELAVLLDLQTYDWDGKGTWVSQKTIAEELGISERTVRDALKKLGRAGAIECQPRPGQSNLYKVKSAWLPADPGNTHRGKGPKAAPTTPEEPAGDPSTICRPPQQNLPHTPAESAAETDTQKNIQKAEARTDWVPPPAASEKRLSGTTTEANQDQIQEVSTAPLAGKTIPPPISSANNSLVNPNAQVLAKSPAAVDYNSARQDSAEETQVVELATRFNEIQSIMGKEKATGTRWLRSLKGFRILLFSGKHGRSYADVSLVLNYLKDNPMRAKEIVNKDHQRGVTNTYHLMYLFDRLHNEALGGESKAEKMFSTRKVRTSDPAQSA